MLAGDARALALLERLAPMTAAPPIADPGAMAALQELRSMLAASATSAAESARRDVARAHGITLAAGVLVSAVTLGTIAFIFAERRRRRRLAQKLEREANHDPLTMLPNRRFFLEWLGYTLAQARRDGNGDRAALHRPRRLQGGQRPVRASSRRRGARRDRRALARDQARRRRARTHRRRRVRARGAECARRARARRARRSDCSPRSAIRRNRSSRTCPSARRSASRSFPTMRAMCRD